MPGDAILPASGAYDVSGAGGTKNTHRLFLLVFAGLLSALYVNYTYYYKYYGGLAPEVTEKWESIESGRDFGKPLPAYLTMRLFWMDKTIAAAKGGEPYTVHDHEMSFYYYGGVLGRIFAFAKGWQVFLFIQMAAASFALLAFPLLAYKITSSLASGLAAPFLFQIFFGQALYIEKTDTYWAYVWVIALGLPLFTLFFKRDWDAKKWLLLCLLGLTAAIGGVVRAYAGLPLFALLVLSLAREFYRAVRRKKAKEAVFCTAAAAAFFLIGAACQTLIPSAFFQKYGYENRRFPPWHTLYMDLGYAPNPYGIETRDEAAEQHAKRIDPETFYSFDGPSHENYFEILKNEYFKIMKEDPAFFFGSYAKKTAGAVKGVFSHIRRLPYGNLFLLGAIIVFPLYRFISRKSPLSLTRPLSPFFFAALFCAAAGMVPALAALPVRVYLLGSMYSCSAAALCLLLAAVKGVSGIFETFFSRTPRGADGDGAYLSAPGEGEAGSPAKERPVLVIVVPCYNAEKVLPASAEKLAEKINALVAAGLVSEKSSLLFVDGASSDTTWNLVQKYHAENPSVVSGIKLSGSGGHENALLSGLLEAKDYAGAVISMDAGLDGGIDAVDRMIEKYRAGFEIVYGVRAERESGGFFKKGAARGFYAVMSLLGADTAYKRTDFRLMGKNSLEALAEYGEVNLFLRGIVPALGYKTAAVYYERKEAPAETETDENPARETPRFIFEDISAFSIRPLRLISVLGVSIFTVSLVMIIYFFTRYFSGNTVTGWTSIVCSLWGIGGLILLSIGVVGEYTGRIYLEAKRRPRYRVEQRLFKRGGPDENPRGINAAD